MRKKQLPVLDPKLVECWSKGGLAPLVLSNLDHSLASALRHRLYRERLKMREVGHEEVGVADQATIGLQPDPDHRGQFRLIIYPANLLINAALERAGITAGDPPPLD